MGAKKNEFFLYNMAYLEPCLTGTMKITFFFSLREKYPKNSNQPNK